MRAREDAEATPRPPRQVIRHFTRFACIDWSGAAGERLPGLALATCDAGDAAPTLLAPPDGGRWSRALILDWLIARAAEQADMLIGVDFSLGFPFDFAGGYFPGLADAPADPRALWRHVDTLCAADPHLTATSYVRHADLARYFRRGAITGAAFASADRNGRLRAVERIPASGAPASCFNLVGAKQVGLSSLTDMRVLHRLGGRIPVWPFDAVPTAGPLIVEIYTAIAARAAGRLTGRAKMRTYEALDTALIAPATASRPTGGAGAIDDHRSDALLTAAWLRRAAIHHALWCPAAPPVWRTEGWTFGVP